MMEIVVIIAVGFCAGYATRAWVSYRRRRLAEEISVYFDEPGPAPSREHVGRTLWRSFFARPIFLSERKEKWSAGLQNARPQ
jgi:hypothetical protein